MFWSHVPKNQGPPGLPRLPKAKRKAQADPTPGLQRQLGLAFPASRSTMINVSHFNPLHLWDLVAAALGN